jgi:lipopolysaccharide/colanic/teichoic acid biosynthesis glycosyltransferase
VAATGQAPDRLQPAASRAQFVAAPADTRLAPETVLVFPGLRPRDGFYARRGKRIVDLVLGSLLGLMLLPLMAAVAFIVLVTSGRPVLYTSERLGMGGKSFPMWKFRTMVRDADAELERWKLTHPDRAAQLLTHWRLPRDPRVTLVGRFLRKSSLDELPQFWNVLRGDMSLVGPRPYLSRESLEPALAAEIVAVRPGITGPFQVCGRKGLAPASRMQLEATYAAESALLRDLAYVALTARPLFRLDGH